MTLEDFFTLSELTNGLTTPSRVRELVAIMEKETDSSGKNVGDLTRQWSTVAGAIAATDNKDCLDLFVDLKGLNFIAKWLNYAQKLFNEDDNSIEETITHLLQAVETFKVGVEKLVDSELWTTVKDLLVHNSAKVQDKARVLSEHWEKKKVSNGSLSDNEKSGGLIDKEAGKSHDVERGSGLSESSLGNTHLAQETSADEKAHELARDETLLSANNDVAGDREDGMVNNSDNNWYPNNDEKCSVHAKTSLLPKSTSEQPTDNLTSSILVESGGPAVSKIHNPRMELPSNEESKPSEGKSITEISSMNLRDGGSHTGLNIDSDAKCPIDGSSDAKEHDGKSLFHKSSSSETRWENLREFKAFNTGIEADGKVKRRDLLTSGCDLANSYGLSKKHTDQEAATSAKRSDNELDYGIVDPLEVARQVAIEVEREVVDYRGQSCNSSEKSPENHIRKPDSPESVRGNESRVSDDSHCESKSDPDSSEEDSQMQEESSSETANVPHINSTQDMAVSQVTEAVKPEVNTEKSLMCDFDLNQVSSEDVDNPTSPVSTQVSIVSASRATPVHGLPNSPLRFEGNLGWKGSASTSAFRPASPRRILENENEPRALESSGSKKREAILAFDLNIAENVDQPTHHGESYAEANSRKSEHFTLDLNHASESIGGVPQDWLAGKFLPREKSVSHSTSSSKQPLSFIDLNDQPSFLNNTSDNSNFSRLPETFDAFGVAKSKETAFSIFGSKVEINAKDNGPETMTLTNGPTPELTLNANMGQTRSFFGIGGPMVQYPNSSMYGYNNMPSGPTMPLSSAIYGSGGPIPYMVDSRGAPVVPHIVGPGSAFPNPFSQPPFVINMNSSNLSNGAGPSRTSFDLNSGSMVADSGSKDTASLGQFLNLGHFRSMDEQMRSNSQPTVSSVVGQKRKEPENGWEDFGLRPYTPTWK